MNDNKVFSAIPFWIIALVTFAVSAALAFCVDRPMSMFRHGLDTMTTPALLKVSAQALTVQPSRRVRKSPMACKGGTAPTR